MKLSEAIALGRVMCTAAPGNQDDGRGGGCALGMAARAMGKTYEFHPDRKLNFLTAGNCEEIGLPVTYPCKCKHPGFSTLGWAVAHLFNEHVFGKCDWTLDQLIDWVKSVEPQ